MGIFAISRNTSIDCILIHSFYFFKLFWFLRGYFNKHGCNHDEVSKTGYSRLSYKVKIKMFWNKGYDVITFAHDIANKLLSRDSNHFVDLVI